MARAASSVHTDQVQIGRYEVERELGRGGMGAVYLAKDPRLGREVAIKVLTSAARARNRERFAREAAALARLDHPHVVKIHQQGSERGQPFLVLDFVPGESLEERLEKGPPLEPRRAVEMARKLADALAHAHAQGILHRDLKPGNVLLRLPDDEVFLTDFGLVRLLEDSSSQLTASGSYLGSPGYLAPEQAAGEKLKLGPATDVYGLGATLYAALTGVPPVQGEDSVQTLLMTLNAPVRPPRELNPAVDRGLNDLVLRCLAKDPAERFPDALSAQRALEGWLASGGSGSSSWLGPAAAVGAGLVSAAALGFALALDDAPPVQPPATPTPSPSRKVLPGQTYHIDEGATEAMRERAMDSYRAGKSAHEEGRTTEALARYSEALAVLKVANLYHSRGNVHADLRDYDAADADYTRALELKPRNPQAYADRGIVRFQAGRHEEGLADLSLSLELKDDPEVRYHRGEKLRLLKRFEGALEDAAHLTRRFPNNSLGPLLAAQTYWIQRRPVEAEQAAREAVRRRPEGAGERRTLALALLDQQRWREALQAAEEALKRADDPDSLRVRGISRIKLGVVEDGLADLERFVLIAPNSPFTKVLLPELEKIRQKLGR